MLFTRKGLMLSKIFLLMVTVVLFALIMPLILWNHKNFYLYDKHYIISFFLVTMIFIIMGLSFTGKKDRTNIHIDVIRLFLFSLVIKFTVIMFLGLNTKQVSDFAFAYDASFFPIPLNFEYYYTISHWILYSEYLRGLNFIFGEGVINGIVFNAVLSSFVAVLIYKIIFKISSNRNWCVISSLLYVIWPINNINVILLTPDYVHIFFSMIGLYITLILIDKKDNGVKRIVLLSLCIGCVFSVSGFFKPIDKIIYIAFFLIGIFFIIDNRQKLKPFVLGYIVILSTSVIVTSLIYTHLDSYAGLKVNRSSFIGNLYTGLSAYSTGVWSEETAIYLDVAKENNFDFDKTNQIMREKIINEIKEFKHLTPLFFYKKIKVAWSTDVSTFFANATIDKNGPVQEVVWESRIRGIGESFYLFVWLFFFLSTARILYSREFKDFSYVNGIITFCSLVIFGFFLILILSEVQDRYKFVVYPYLSIVSGFSVSEIARHLRVYFSKKNSFIRKR